MYPDVQREMKIAEENYSLRIGDTRYEVCKSLFLATLSLKEDTVYNWLAVNESEHGMTKSSKNTKQGNNTKPAARESALKFLNEVPKMPSHYCRARTSNMYLETELASLSEL